MTDIIVVTNNKKKCKELHALLNNNAYSVHTYSDRLGHTIDIEETGSTFKANAILKVQAIVELGELFKDSIIIADDSGIEVEALNNEPGIYSARYGGEGLSDEDRCHYLLKQLGDNQNRNARFRCVIAAKFPDQDIISFDGKVEGLIAKEKKGITGFGYDPLFIPNNYEKSFAELNPSIKSKISHRANALAKFSSYLIKKVT